MHRSSPLISVLRRRLRRPGADATSSACGPTPRSPTSATRWSASPPAAPAGVQSMLVFMVLYMIDVTGFFACLTALQPRRQADGDHRRHRRPDARAAGHGAGHDRASRSRRSACRRSPASGPSSTCSRRRIGAGPVAPGSPSSAWSSQRGGRLLLSAPDQGDVVRPAARRRSTRRRPTPAASPIAAALFAFPRRCWSR